MAEAAGDFLESLDPEQRRLAQWPFPSDGERRRWFYTPTDHGGLPLNQMRPHQQQLAFRLLARGLSRPAYVTACTIVGLENVLDELEGWAIGWDRERGRDPGLYYLRVFGEPAAGGGWSWRFGGHHVSVNHLVVDGEVRASTPLFLGADPAASPLLGGGELRPLGPTEDLARELFEALDGEERRRALISPVAPFDLVTANRSELSGGERPLPLREIWRGRFEGELGDLVDSMQRRVEQSLQITEQHLEALRYTEQPKGITGAEIGAGQRELLRRLVEAHVSRLPDELGALEMDRFRDGGIEAVAFAWAGGSARGDRHYYRLQGPRLLIEYDNAQRDGNHAHSVWRDPVADFGSDVLREHHRRSHPAG